MKVFGQGAFSCYVNVSQDNLQDSLVRHRDCIDLIEEYLDFFTVIAGDKYHLKSIWPVMLMMSASHTLLAAVRVAASGQGAVIYPILRSALETACYAHEMKRCPEKIGIWERRDKSGTAKKKCQDSFAGSVKRTANAVGQENGWSKQILELYESSIQWGAHPNPLALLPYVSVSETTDNYVYRIDGVSNVGSDEIREGLIRCLTYFPIIAIIYSNFFEAEPDKVNPIGLRLCARGYELMQTAS